MSWNEIRNQKSKSRTSIQHDVSRPDFIRSDVGNNLEVILEDQGNDYQHFETQTFLEAPERCLIGAVEGYGGAVQAYMTPAFPITKPSTQYPNPSQSDEMRGVTSTHLANTSMSLSHPTMPGQREKRSEAYVQPISAAIMDKENDLRLTMSDQFVEPFYSRNDVLSFDTVKGSTIYQGAKQKRKRTDSKSSATQDASGAPNFRDGIGNDVLSEPAWWLSSRSHYTAVDPLSACANETIITTDQHQNPEKTPSNQYPALGLQRIPLQSSAMCSSTDLRTQSSNYVTACNRAVKSTTRHLQPKNNNGKFVWLCRGSLDCDNVERCPFCDLLVSDKSCPHKMRDCRYREQWRRFERKDNFKCHLQKNHNITAENADAALEVYKNIFVTATLQH